MRSISLWKRKPFIAPLNQVGSATPDVRLKNYFILATHASSFSPLVLGHDQQLVLDCGNFAAGNDVLLIMLD